MALARASTTLHFPSFHKMQRWKDYGKRLLFIGTLGEYVDFAKLPAALQKEKLATALGSKASSNADDHDACGSPGEARPADQIAS